MLRVIVVGAGIVGLAVAANVLTAQWEDRVGGPTADQTRPLKLSVIVLERHDDLIEFGAGIQAPPNASRVLCRLGLRRAFEEYAVSPGASFFRRLDTGHLINKRPLNEDSYAERIYGSPYVFDVNLTIVVLRLLRAIPPVCGRKKSIDSPKYQCLFHG